MGVGIRWWYRTVQQTIFLSQLLGEVLGERPRNVTMCLELLDLWGSTGSSEYQISSFAAEWTVGWILSRFSRNRGIHKTGGGAGGRSESQRYTVVDLNTVDMSDEGFSNALELFLICFICATPLNTARHIHEQAEFRLFPSQFGKLIGLIRKEALATLNEVNSGLVTTGWAYRSLL